MLCADGWMLEVWAVRGEQRLHPTSIRPCITRTAGTQRVNAGITRTKWKYQICTGTTHALFIGGAVMLFWAVMIRPDYWRQLLSKT